MANPNITVGARGGEYAFDNTAGGGVVTLNRKGGGKLRNTTAAAGADLGVNFDGAAPTATAPVGDAGRRIGPQVVVNIPADCGSFTYIGSGSGNMQIEFD